MPSEPRYVYLQRRYSQQEGADVTSKIIGVWPLEPSNLIAVPDARACPFHRHPVTTREYCGQCHLSTLPIAYQYTSDALVYVLLAGEVGLLVLDPYVPAEPTEEAEPLVAQEPTKPKRSHKRKGPVTVE